MRSRVQLSAIVPVTERNDPVTALYREYRRGLEATGLSFEIIYVLDGPRPEVLDELKRLQETDDALTVITLARWFGESTALTVGFEHAAGGTILILPAYQQVQADEIPRVVAALDGCDMVLARRWPRLDSAVNRAQSWLFNRLLRLVSELEVHDAGCGMRALRRQVLEEVHIYGDLHRFLPFMAYRQGFRITEVEVAQAKQDHFQRIYPPGIYLRRLLDMLTVFFLLRFTKKPLRFFGLLGGGIALLGTAAVAAVVIERLALGTPLAERPALLLGSLLIVLGVQVFAVGLIGEIVIFTHAAHLRDYTVEQVIAGQPERPRPRRASATSRSRTGS